MEEHVVKILDITPVTHDVNRYQVEKPAGYHFVPGQATEVAIRKPGWEEQSRPFTFTGLNAWDYLEFTIKSYSDHAGVTNELLSLEPGDALILHDVWGAIQYKGPGVFIAGGAGITPFIAILRELRAMDQLDDNLLIFANKTSRDIILREELETMLQGRFINILSEEKNNKFPYGFVSKTFLLHSIPDFNRHFYICGPQAMIDSVQNSLKELGAGEEAIIIEL